MQKRLSEAKALQDEADERTAELLKVRVGAVHGRRVFSALGMNDLFFACIHLM